VDLDNFVNRTQQIEVIIERLSAQATILYPHTALAATNTATFNATSLCLKESAERLARSLMK
jgi:hypothetical protein